MKQIDYPHYISTCPTGEDLFDGKSQEKISKAIAEHIKYIDNHPENERKTIMPRIIGIEGKWGSGKSNVLKMLQFKDLIKDPKYKFFTYDAWANQEDLQRRTIIEQLTSYLINRKLLKGEVKVQLQKVDENNEFHTVDKMVTWNEKLDMLMAKRVKNITRSVSPLNMEFKLFMLTLALTPTCVALMDALENFVPKCCYIIATIILFFLPAIISAVIILARKDLDIKNVLHAYQSTTENKTTHQVVNESEPTIHEFSDWMKEISKGLGDFKLVVVFDNMDRLPADKVKKLWSSIHSIFASEGYKTDEYKTDEYKNILCYENIWCIIPYDFEHLSCAFGKNEKEREQLTKYFIDKSFPVVYRVPEPVILDYKNIFDNFFVKAFGTTVSDNDIETINRCYRITFPRPNIRSIISFINRMVTLAKVHKTISYVSMAIYLLKEDILLKHPTGMNYLTSEEMSITTDEFILTNKFLSGFERIVQKDNNLQKEISSLVYGIDPERAYQLPMFSALKKCFEENGSRTSLNTYVKHPLFASILTEVVYQIDSSYYPTVSKKLSEVNVSNIPEETQMSIRRSWDYLADQYQYVSPRMPKSKYYSSFERNILHHVNDERQKKVVKVFCSALTSDESVIGDVLFDTLNELFNEPFANNWDIFDICPETFISAKQFIYYVKAASSLYEKFPIRTDLQELNNYLTEKLSAEEDLTDVIKILRKDENYDMKSVADNAASILTEETANYLIAVRLLHVIKLFPEIDIKPSRKYILSLWQALKQKEEDIIDPSDEYIELYVLLAVSCPGSLNDESPIENEEIAERSLSYTTTSNLISLNLQYPGDCALQNILVSSICHNVVDDNPSIEGGFVTKWDQLLSSIHNIGISQLLDFAETWGYNNLTNEEDEMSFNQLLPDETSIDKLLRSESHIAKALIAKAVSEINQMSEHQFFQMNNLSPTNNYWYKILEKLINGDMIVNPLGDNLKKIVVKALQLVACNKLQNNCVVQNLLSLGCADFPSYATEVNNISRGILRGDNYSVSVENFPILHKWLEHTGINERGKIRDSADTILAPVIDDVNCQNIILSNREYYQPIIVESIATSSALHNKLKQLIKSEKQSEFIQYINNIVRYNVEE